MALSYGDIAYITGKWEDWKKDHGSDAGSASDFIESECTQDYSFEEQDEIFSLIGCIEEGE